MDKKLKITGWANISINLNEILLNQEDQFEIYKTEREAKYNDSDHKTSKTIKVEIKEL